MAKIGFFGKSALRNYFSVFDLIIKTKFRFYNSVDFGVGCVFDALYAFSNFLMYTYQFTVLSMLKQIKTDDMYSKYNTKK